MESPRSGWQRYHFTAWGGEAGVAVVAIDLSSSSLEVSSVCRSP